MPTLNPPEYPDRPDAPLLSFGPSFAEEIARSLIAVVWHGDEGAGTPDEDVQVAASLTMLEAFHPRDHLECMIAAQGVACHASIMDCFARAMNPEIDFAQGVKLRANAAQLARTFSALLRDIERRQAKPLPPGGPSKGEASGDSGGPPPRKSRARKSAATAGDDEPEDLLTRPDGTPGSLAAYAPKPPDEDVFVPREPAIMVALATRPKPWRQVNTPKDQPAPEPVSIPASPEADTPVPRARVSGILDPMARIFTGDALARFASARLDPDAPAPIFSFEREDSVFELELLDTGPDSEAERAALAAAHPEGKPAVSIRHGHAPEPEPEPSDDT